MAFRVNLLRQGVVRVESGNRGETSPPPLGDWLAQGGPGPKVYAEYNQFWRTVVETMTDALMVVDTDGIIVSLNRALTEISGYRREELIGRSCAVLDLDTCERARAQGGAHHCALFRDGGVRRCRTMLRTKDGRVVPLIKNAAVLKDSAGRVIGGVETLTDLSELEARDRVITALRQELSGQDGFQGMIGTSPVMKKFFQLISAVSVSGAPVVITGPSGSGKELAAQAIHSLGPRAKGPFIKVNCAALNESLLESELFGHAKGAFTGADRERKGRFEAADGGDIFLDEIGDLPLATQIKLLRVLQEGEIERVGENRPIEIDVRIITATNQDLSELMAEGRFREDLYYRIAALPIRIPPLAQRREDIPLLAETFINRIRLKTSKNITGASREAMEILMAYSWPGNVRELINALEYGFVLCPEGLLAPEHLPAHLLTGTAGRGPTERTGSGGGLSPEEEGRIRAAMRKTGGNKTEAAALLGISRVTLWKKLKRMEDGA